MTVDAIIQSDRAALADAMNDYENRVGTDPWPINNPGTHRDDCMHIGYIVDVLERNGWQIVRRDGGRL